MKDRRIAIDIDESTYKKVRINAIEKDLSLKKYVTNLIRKDISKKGNKKSTC